MSYRSARWASHRIRWCALIYCELWVSRVRVFGISSWKTPSLCGNWLCLGFSMPVSCGRVYVGRLCPSGKLQDVGFIPKCALLLHLTPPQCVKNPLCVPTCFSRSQENFFLVVPLLLPPKILAGPNSFGVVLHLPSGFHFGLFAQSLASAPAPRGWLE